MYVLIMRVFSNAGVLFTFISHASLSTGSQTFTMRTFACGMHTTFSMPSVTWLTRASAWGLANHTFGKSFGKRVHLLETYHGRLDAYINYFSVSRQL